MIKEIMLVTGCCVGFGLLRMPVENHVLREEKTVNLLMEPPQFDAENRLEQQVSLVALGGLRNFVAAVISMDAFRCFQKSDWIQLEKKYNQIVTLAPHNTFYWDWAAWHLGTNAASEISRDKSLPSVVRRTKKRAYYELGNSFYERGIRANPQSEDLLFSYAQILSNPAFFPDYEKSYDVYLRAYSLVPHTKTERFAYFALSHIPERMAEAYAMGKRLYKTPVNRKPTVRCLLFAQQNALDIPKHERIPFSELFPDTQNAVTYMTNYLNAGAGYPTAGIQEKLKELKTHPADGK